MSITETADASFTADANFGTFYTGLTGTVGVLIQDGSGSVVTARTTTGIVEAPTGSGIYTKRDLVAPNTVGSYELVWDTGGGSPVFATEDLSVVGGSSAGLSTNALISVADAQAWLRRLHATGQAATDDTSLLTLAINGVSEDIINYSEREPFDPTGNDSDLARTFEYDGSGFLNLAPYDLRSITSVTLAGQTLTPTTGAGDGDYVPMPRNKNRWGTYDYLTLRGYFKLGPSHFLSSPVLKTRDVVVTGKWGISTTGQAGVPQEMYLACLIAVDDHYRNPEQADQRGSGEFQIVEAPRLTPGSGGLPQGAVDKLEPLLRMIA